MSILILHIILPQSYSKNSFPHKFFKAYYIHGLSAVIRKKQDLFHLSLLFFKHFSVLRKPHPHK